MLMIDRMRAEGFTISGSNSAREHLGLQAYGDMLKELRDSALSAVVYRIDNVADYFFDQIDNRAYKDFQDFLEMLPCAAPVNDAAWMEFPNPFSERYDSQFHERTTVPDRIGILVRVGVDDPKGQTDRDERWFLEVKMFACGPSWFHFVGDVGLTVRRNGEIARVLESVVPSDHDGNMIVTWIGPALLALSFLHCKNVIIHDQEGIYPSRQARREAQRRNDPPLVTYKTLQIEPMKKVLATEGGIATNGLKKALHICRGHFAEYGDEYGKGKLFGKYEGRFFVPAHVRGSAESGEVIKDYNIKAPRKEAA